MFSQSGDSGCPVFLCLWEDDNEASYLVPINSEVIKGLSTYFVLTNT